MGLNTLPLRAKRACKPTQAGAHVGSVDHVGFIPVVALVEVGNAAIGGAGNEVVPARDGPVLMRMIHTYI